MPEHMSPEQLWGGELDGRSDIYCMAVVLYRMLTGGPPFREDTTQEVASPTRRSSLARRWPLSAPSRTVFSRSWIAR